MHTVSSISRRARRNAHRGVAYADLPTLSRLTAAVGDTNALGFDLQEHLHLIAVETSRLRAARAASCLS